MKGVPISEETKSTILRDYHSGLPETEIAARHGVCVATVHNVRNRAQAEKRREDLTEDVRQAVVERYRAGELPVNLGHEFRIHKSTLHRILRGAKVALHGVRKVQFDAHFFQARSETTAYWMGFLMADGSLQKNPQAKDSWRLSLGLQQRDLAHLQEFCDAVGTPKSAVKLREDRLVNPGTGKQYTTRKATVVLNDVRFADWLAPWGIVASKTYHFVPPTIPERLYPPYLRGWFDGDGCIYRRKNENWCGFEAVVVAHERRALQWYARALRAIGYNGGMRIYSAQAGESKYWRLSVSRAKDVLTLTDLLGAAKGICLERKWGKVLSVPRERFDHFEMTAENRRAAREMYNEGQSTTNIAGKLGCTPGTVYKCLKAQKVRIRGAQTTEKQRREIVRLHSRGMFQGEIAACVGVCQPTVSDVLKRCGVKARPRGRARWPEEKVRRMIAAYARLKSIEKVASLFRVSSAGVRKRLFQVGVRIKGAKP